LTAGARQAGEQAVAADSDDGRHGAQAQADIQEVTAGALTL
jgi:hypothetical protein